MQLTFDDSDARLLKEALESYLSDLRMEIADTDRMDFRDELKRRRDALQRILAQLESKDEPEA